MVGSREHNVLSEFILGEGREFQVSLTSGTR